MKLYPDQQPVAPASTYESARRTGFAENWSSALGLTISEDLPVVSRIVSSTVESQRKQQIQEHIKSGDIPQATARFYGGDINGLAGYARDVLGLGGLVTDEEYHEQVAREYKVLRDYSKDTFSRQSGMGLLGEIAGVAHAMAIDPIYAVSALTGYGTAATVGRAVLHAGAIEAGVEAVAQVPKMSFKKEIDSEYSGAEAIAQIVFAGLGAGVLAGIGKGISRVLTPKGLTVGEATAVLEKMSKNNPEMEPVLNTIKRADPGENLVDVLKADEAVDIRRATEGPLTGRDPKADPEIKAQEIETLGEEAFYKRQPIAKEGVPHGTHKGKPPKAEPDTRHHMVVEADNVVVKADKDIKIMEDCF